MIEFSFVEKSTMQAHARYVSLDWVGFVELMQDCSTIPRPATKADKEFHTPAITGAVWAQNATKRDKTTALYSGLHALDLDYSSISVSEWLEFLQSLGWYYVLHTTTFSTVLEPRYRIILPFDRPVLLSEWDAMWFALESVFGKQMDTKTKNINRLFFVPQDWIYENSYKVFYWGGEFALPVDWLMQQYPYIPPPPPVIPQISNSAYPSDWVNIWDSHFAGATMVVKFTTSQKGGRLWRFICSVVFKAQKAGYRIAPADLEIMAWEFNRHLANKDSRTNMRKEVEKAIKSVWGEI